MLQIKQESFLANPENSKKISRSSNVVNLVSLKSIRHSSMVSYQGGLLPGWFLVQIPARTRINKFLTKKEIY